jgi:hypothetical protein
LLVAFAALSWMSWREKGVTVDEPLHFMSAWITVRDHDFQTDPENPPLWKYWAMLPQVGAEMQLDRATLYEQILPRDRFDFYRWAPEQMFSSSNDGDALLRRSREAMLLIGVALGAAIAAFAWRIAGLVAAVAATTLFAFDPNFLAHAPLVKNDVIVSLCWLMVSAGLWSMGKRVSIANVLLVCAGSAVGILSKFTGLFLAPLVVLVLALRAVSPGKWAIGRFAVARTSRKIAVASGLVLVIGVFVYLSIWATYGFRFLPSSDPNVSTSLDRVIATIARNEWIAQTGEFTARPPPEVMARWRPSMDVRVLRALHDAHLLPHAFVDGLLSIKAAGLARPGFLLGQLNLTGWWYYYPVAFAVKTPLATLVVSAVLAIVAIRTWRHRSIAMNWTRVCFLTSAGLYVAISMTSSINLGVRHLFPVYPLLYVAAGWAVARLWQTARARLALVALGALLMVETLIAFPNYIPFFNAFAGGSRGGGAILTDSNVDWGQDLPLLAKWQAQHPDELLQCGCFSAVDPAHYGIRSLPLPGGPSSAGTPHWPPRPGVVAVSATNLQGAYRMFWPRGEDLYAPFRTQEPSEVRGGSIYLYRVEP